MASWAVMNTVGMLDAASYDRQEGIAATVFDEHCATVPRDPTAKPNTG
jgi:hypothetical protein